MRLHRTRQGRPAQFNVPGGWMVDLALGGAERARERPGPSARAGSVLDALHRAAIDPQVAAIDERSPL